VARCSLAVVLQASDNALEWHDTAERINRWYDIMFSSEMKVDSEDRATWHLVEPEIRNAEAMITTASVYVDARNPSITLPLSLFLSLPLSLTHTHTLSLSLSLFPPLSLSLSLSRCSTGLTADMCAACAPA